MRASGGWLGQYWTITNTLDGAPTSGGSRLPGIEYLDAEPGEILQIPRGYDKVVLQCRRRYQAVRSVDGLPLQLALSFKYAPSFRNCFAHRQDASVEPRAERVVEPLPQASAAMLFGMNGESLAKLADANHAEIKQAVVN